VNELLVEDRAEAVVKDSPAEATVRRPTDRPPSAAGAGRSGRRARRTDSSTELAAIVADDPELQQQLRTDPVGTLQNLAKPLENDYWIYRMVVGSLALSALFVVVGVFVLAALNDKVVIPDAMIAIGSAAIAAMAALLVPGSHGR
jgi:hypothetical protein